MRSNAWFPMMVVFALAASGCSDDTANPFVPEDSPDPPEAPGISGLIVSEARDPDGLSYISVAPGHLADVVSVGLRNVSAGTAGLPVVAVVDGGFDPVAVSASTGDRLELDLIDGSGGTRVVSAIVPEHQVPTIVRVDVGPDARNVAVDAAIRVIFSEPLRASTAREGLGLESNGWFFYGDLDVLPDEPWTVEFFLPTTLEPATRYDVTVWSGITDFWGEELEVPDGPGNAFGPLWDFEFVTEAPANFEVTQPGRIAFVSSRGGFSHIYVVNPDGSELAQVAPGLAPSWSPDGRRIAFQTAQYDPPDIHIVGADGSGERLLVANGYSPAWSPDGRRLAFGRDDGIGVIDANGSNEETLFGPETALAHTGIAFTLFAPSWSPDGRSIAMTGRDQQQDAWSVLVADADGSRMRVLDVEGVDGLTRIAWSPDGARLLLSARGEVRSLSADGTGPLVHAYGDRPDWSQDGLLIAYERPRPGSPADLPSIFIADLETGRRRELLPADPVAPPYRDSSPVWSRR